MKAVLTDKRTNEQRYYDALETIAIGYFTPNQLRRRGGQYGATPTEEIEFFYKNMQYVAKTTIKGKRRPK